MIFQGWNQTLRLPKNEFPNVAEFHTHIPFKGTTV